MAKRLNYTQDEWLALAKAPIQVALAVMGVETSHPFQILREQQSLERALQLTGKVSGAGALIHELHIETQAQLNELTQTPLPAIDVAQTAAQMSDIYHKLAVTVDAKELPGEAEEYKRWVLWLGREVAAAASEGEADAVSANEHALLTEIAQALGLQRRQQVTIAPEQHEDITGRPTPPTGSEPSATGDAESTPAVIAASTLTGADEPALTAPRTAGELGVGTSAELPAPDVEARVVPPPPAVQS